MAAYTSGGWRFVAPVDGISVYIKANSEWASYRAGTWELGVVRGSSVMVGGVQVIGARLGPIVSPSGGTTVDSEARGTINQLLAAMRAHGLIES